MILTGITIFNCIAPKTDNVAHYAHLGGLIYGFYLSGIPIGSQSILKKLQIYQHEKELMKDQEQRAKVDVIHEKVNREGLQNLTWREKNFLKTASKRYKRETNFE